MGLDTEVHVKDKVFMKICDDTFVVETERHARLKNIGFSDLAKVVPRLPMRSEIEDLEASA